MYSYWKKRTHEEIKKQVFEALDQNINYQERNVLGIPASHLDTRVFNQDSSFFSNAPFMSALVKNPNHIGVHTLGKSESFFKGTHKIEQRLIDICAVDILKGEEGKHDGYVASGGTEANIQAIWIYRNYFIKEEDASRDEICIICSADSHYSMDKAGNLLSLSVFKVPVYENSREISLDAVNNTIEEARTQGKKYFIVVCNMMTTMFGSVDNIDTYTKALHAQSCTFRLHVDGAFGGFYFPFANSDSKLTFQNPAISSFTLDAHKMAQAPYGTGIFLIRKGLIEYVNTQEASYVEGEDFTLIGSRSGANAIAVWMILVKNGPFGWHEKIFILQKRADWMCKQLDALNIVYYRHPNSNIITIKSESIKTEIAHKYGLVPDNHAKSKWFKIVIMDHVTIENLDELIIALKD